MKPICKYCKFIFHTSTLDKCNCDPTMNVVGDLFYENCLDKNKDFKCLDFKPSFFNKRKYK